MNIEVSRIIFLFVLHRAFNENIKEQAILVAKKYIEKHESEKQGLQYLFDRKNDARNPDIAHKIVSSYETLRKYYIKFKKDCNLDLASFIELMQNFGDQVRTYGIVSPDETSDKKPENIFILPDAIRRLIRAYITARNDKYFVIDAFRNPYEVEYFKRRYSEFYLVSIHRPSRERQGAMQDLNPESIEKLKRREEGKLIPVRGKGNIHQWVTSQNLMECSQKADYYIHNPFDSSKTYPHLRYHLIRLICLSQYPGCTPPVHDERCMQLAMSARQNSGCISRHVGAVVVDKNGYTLGVGWNDPPHGQIPCSLRTADELLKNLDKQVFSEFETSSNFVDHISKRKLGNQPFCFKDELSSLKNKKFNEYTRALHAEENALLQSMIHGTSAIKDSVLYTTDSPCTLCSKKAYQLGVNRIIFIEEYPGISLEQSVMVGKRSISVEQFEGVTGAAYFKLFAPLMPEKDFIKLYS